MGFLESANCILSYTTDHREIKHHNIVVVIIGKKQACMWSVPDMDVFMVCQYDTNATPSASKNARQSASISARQYNSITMTVTARCTVTVPRPELRV